MEYNKLVEGEALTKDKFKKPSREFGIMPFWFWNGDMEYDEMEYQLKEYYAKGIPGIYIHARFGILDSIGYLTDEWFDRVQFTIDKAREIGLQVWVYDEYNWPSGTAGKQVMDNNPDLTQRYLELVEGDVEGQYFQFMEGTDSRYNDLEQSEPVYACAILKEDLEKGEPKFLNLMSSLSFDKVITWEAPKGPWKMFYFIERQASWYSDVLNPQTTQDFIDLTHEKYKEYLGDDFRKDIKGFYTDEPAMHYFEVARDNYVLPWSKQMFKIFREHNGYDLKEHLPHLYFDIGEKSQQIRYDYFSALTKQYEKTFYKKIGDWCKENEMVFTGHLLFEESLRLHARTGGNLFKHLKHFDMTGVDHLYPRIGTREMPNEHVALKLASSAAHQFGSTRLLCESMGGSYWDCTMERMKWIADWEYVLGVNLLNPHGFHYTIEGERKRDWPPSQFYHHTWWNEYGRFNDYMARLGYTLSGGRHRGQVAILYPINSIWATYTPQARNKIGELIENDFNYMTDRLLRMHIEFDYLDEDVMADCEIKDGKFCIQGEEYEVLILPGATHIKGKTLNLMEKFVESGGKIIANTLLPRYAVEDKTDDFKERIENLFGKCPDILSEEFMNKENKELTLEINEKSGVKGKTILIKGPSLNAADGQDILKEALMKCITPGIEIDSEEVFCLNREKDGHNLFFIINPTDSEIQINITLPENTTPALWDLENGGVKDADVYDIREGRTYMSYKLYPYGSMLLESGRELKNGRVTYSDIKIESCNEDKICGYARLESDGKIEYVKDRNPASKTISAVKPLPVKDLKGKWKVTTDKPNTILTDRWKVAYDNGQKADDFSKPGYDFTNFFDFHMGAWEVQLPEERDEEKYPATLWYVTEISAEYIPGDLSLMIDGFKGSGYELFVNGRKITDPGKRSYLDAQIKQVDVSGEFRTGKNTIAVKLTVDKKSDGMVDLLKVIGTFLVKEINGNETICEPETQIETGDITAMGMPYFSGTVEYEKEIDLSEEFAGKRIILKADVGTDILEVQINGNKIPALLWKPYETDITKFAVPGKNKIVLKVTNTLVNILEGTKQPSGLFGAELVPYDEYEVIL